MTTARLETLYRLVEGETPSFLRTVTEAVASAHNEREFQTKVTRAIEEFANKVGVDLLFREEYTLATGRADAVYNRLVIEYEKPGSMRADLDHAHTRHAVNQVKQYIEEVAKRERHDQDRLLGIAWDGQIMIFARYRDGHWYEEPPLQVNRQSATRFLRSLVSLSSGRALIPENLVEDFGAQHLRSQRVARALYHALDGHTNDLTANLFRQWQLFFSQVSGYEEASARLRDKKELRQFARGMGLRPETTDPPRLFFTIHTYFSFLVKAIARLVLESYAGGQLGTTPMTVLANLEGESLKRELERLEDGGIFHTLGLMNLLEGDFFSWYLQAWSPEVEDALRLVLAQLAEYNPATIQDDPFAARDLLKKLYHYLLPRELRHDLGEYYTPDWLAERVLSQLNEPLYVIPKADRQPATLFPGRRLLDPACGSGTFLVLAIRAIKENCIRQGLSEADTLDYILENVVGIDLNPLAVMAARVNYILAIADLIKYRRAPIVIPVYLADSIKTPTEGKTLFEQGMPLDTVVGRFLVPRSVNTRESIGKLTDLLDEYVSAQFETGAFVERVRKDLGITAGSLDETSLHQLYEQLLDLEKKGLDGIWARVLKNAFMPLFIGQFDYVVGNPPWVNWESLPDKYRSDTSDIWAHYELFPHKGFKAILGGSKDDISILMTYVSCDKYLKSGGKLAFLITQTVFKSAEGGRGFRRFRLGDKDKVRVIHVDDMSTLKPFEGATNRTSVFVLQKGSPTRYPVPYTYWRKIVKGKGLSYESSLEEVESLTARAHFQAVPVDPTDITSAWLTARPASVLALRKIIGKSNYQGRKGVYASANGVFWIELVSRLPGGHIVAKNIVDGARQMVESTVMEIEPDLVYPLLRGRDVARWSAQPSAHILVTHLQSEGLKAIPEANMQRMYPKAFSYLKHYEALLTKTGLIRRYFTRSDSKGRKSLSGPFYSMFNVGVYTFSSHKVVWREICTSLTAAVVGEIDNIPIIPDHKLVLADFSTADEAHYVCAILNSSPANLLLQSYGVTTQISTHIFNHLAIPTFDVANKVHIKLARFSIDAHRYVSEQRIDDLRQVEQAIDSTVAELWKISSIELEGMKQSLSEYAPDKEELEEAQEEQDA